MSSINQPKIFSVDVYSDYGVNSQNPWVHAGEFSELSDAIEVCKKVVDDFLRAPINRYIEPEVLAHAFLSYGDVPVISGTQNLPNFDIYEYLTQRCAEISSPQQSI